jgi:hypothetical protein
VRNLYFAGRSFFLLFAKSVRTDQVPRIVLILEPKNPSLASLEFAGWPGAVPQRTDMAGIPNNTVIRGSIEPSNKRNRIRSRRPEQSVQECLNIAVCVYFQEVDVMYFPPTIWVKIQGVNLKHYNRRFSRTIE